jgi:rhodanese-related sulfurtransferase
MFARLMGLKTISPDELHRMVERQTVKVVDVDSPQSWAKARVPGALNLDPANYAEKDLPADKSAAPVFYCSNFMCREAPNAARRAKQMGYTNVQVMSAGISGWLGANLPVESGNKALERPELRSPRQGTDSEFITSAKSRYSAAGLEANPLVTVGRWSRYGR